MNTTYKKIFASIMTVASLAIGVTGLSASAYTDSSSYGAFEWSTTSAKTTNITNTKRRVAANITVYRDGTGEYVTGNGGENVGTYGTYAYASVPSYSSSSYNFKCIGTVYNGDSPYSGVAYTFVKYLY